MVDSEVRNSTLKQTKGTLTEGRVGGAVDPEELGVEFLRQLGLKEAPGPWWIDSAQETFRGGR